MLDLQTISMAMLSLAGAAITAAIPIVVPATLRRVGIANNADIAARVEVAADAAAGLAYQYAAGQTKGLTDIVIHNQALDLGAQYVADHLPDAMRYLNLTPDHVRAMVSARLGALLAADPTVSAGVPVPLVPMPE